DGDAGGGEFVQEFMTLTGAALDDGTVDVELVVDGTADPATCASDASDVPTADGCMTLSLAGTTLTDSYGTIVPTDIEIETELENGAHPGWYTAYDAGDGPNVGLGFDLTVTPVVLTAPRTADDCKDGGYEDFEFTNQGQCVASVRANGNAGK
ncbi:hypothetical protein PU560_08390, partial [Georgenia sp. 10Sc9-8]|nr:hypothetical protein [Georgenia halotolerans]